MQSLPPRYVWHCFVIADEYAICRMVPNPSSDNHVNGTIYFHQPRVCSALV